VNGVTQTASTTYAVAATYSAKVIIERGAAPPAEQRTIIMVTPAGYSPPSGAGTVRAGRQQCIDVSNVQLVVRDRCGLVSPHARYCGWSTAK